MRKFRCLDLVEPELVDQLLRFQQIGQLAPLITAAPTVIGVAMYGTGAAVPEKNS